MLSKYVSKVFVFGESVSFGKNSRLKFIDMSLNFFIQGRFWRLVFRDRLFIVGVFDDIEYWLGSFNWYFEIIGELYDELIEIKLVKKKCCSLFLDFKIFMVVVNIDDLEE